MKSCPFCAEEIQDAAIKCKHCGSDLSVTAATAIPEPSHLQGPHHGANSHVLPQYSATAPKKSPWLPIGISMVALAVIGGFAWSRTTDSNPSVDEGKLQEPQSETVGAGSLKPPVEASAHTPREELELSAVARTLVELASQDESGSAHDWSGLRGAFSSLRWEDVQDNDYAYAKGAFIPVGDNPSADDSMKYGLSIRVKGARTMIFAVELGFADAAGSAPLQSVVETDLSFKEMRCDSDERASSVERWYRLSVKASKPIIAKYELSFGSAGSFEALTIDHKLELPMIGSDAIEGKWTDKCQR